MKSLRMSVFYLSGDGHHYMMESRQVFSVSHLPCVPGDVDIVTFSFPSSHLIIVSILRAGEERCVFVAMQGDVQNAGRQETLLRLKNVP